MRLHIAVTTALDVLGLLLVAGGVGRALFPVAGWWCLVAAGVVIIGGSALAAARQPSQSQADVE